VRNAPLTFNLHIPANLLLFFAISALALSASALPEVAAG